MDQNIKTWEAFQEMQKAIAKKTSKKVLYERMAFKKKSQKFFLRYWPIIITIIFAIVPILFLTNDGISIRVTILLLLTSSSMVWLLWKIIGCQLNYLARKLHYKNRQSLYDDFAMKEIKEWIDRFNVGNQSLLHVYLPYLNMQITKFNKYSLIESGRSYWPTLLLAIPSFLLSLLIGLSQIPGATASSSEEFLSIFVTTIVLTIILIYFVLVLIKIMYIPKIPNYDKATYERLYLLLSMVIHSKE